MQVKKQQLELNTEHRTGSKLGEEEDKAVYCHLAYLASVQSSTCEMPGWVHKKVASRLLGGSTTSDMQMITTLVAESEEELMSLLMGVKRGERKSLLETQHSKN